MMIDYGVDWGTYSCSGWAGAFGTSYPILDGEIENNYNSAYKFMLIKAETFLNDK